MIGAIVNTLAAVVGGLLGSLLKKGIPERFADLVQKGLALCVLYIGIKGSLVGTNTLVTILSLVLGAILGELLDIDRGIERLGAWAQRKLSKGGSRLGEGFVTASLLFCVGSMAVVGSLQSGLTGNHETIFTKSMLDFVSAIILASTLGLGVCLSGAFVLVYQGAIVLLLGRPRPQRLRGGGDELRGQSAHRRPGPQYAGDSQAQGGESPARHVPSHHSLPLYEVNVRNNRVHALRGGAAAIRRRYL